MYAEAIQWYFVYCSLDWTLFKFDLLCSQCGIRFDLLGLSSSSSPCLTNSFSLFDRCVFRVKRARKNTHQRIIYSLCLHLFSFSFVVSLFLFFFRLHKTSEQLLSQLICFCCHFDWWLCVLYWSYSVECGLMAITLKTAATTMAVTTTDSICRNVGLYLIWFPICCEFSSYIHQM